MDNFIIYSIIGLAVFSVISFVVLSILKPSRNWEDKIKKM